MPLKRTPPSTPKLEQTLPTPVQLRVPQISSHPSSSEQDPLSDPANDDSNITRQKRKRTNTTDNQMANFMVDMKKLFNDFCVSQDKKIDTIYTALDEIKTQNSEIRASVEFLSQKYETMLEEISTLKTKNLEIKTQMSLLEAKIDKMEGSTRSTCLEIRNIPMQKPESKIELLKTVTEIGKLLNVSIQPYDVKDVFRIGSRNSETSTTIVELTSVLTKEKILNMYKKYNKDHSRLSTENLKLKGPQKPIFISENLSPKKKRLFYLARSFASSNGYKYCWVTNGKIYIRQKDGATLTPINEELDLNKLVKED